MGKDTFITVASYGSRSDAESDWEQMEKVARGPELYLGDAALVEKDASGKWQILERQRHHGWGKGALLGALFGVLFPPSLIGAAVVGGFSGGLIARLNRSLDKGDVKALGDTMAAGDISLVAVTDGESVETVKAALGAATKIETRQADVGAEELQAELDT